MFVGLRLIAYAKYGKNICFGIMFILFRMYIIIFVIVIPWARGICLIYMPKPEGRRPEGAGIYIRKIPSAHVITNIFHFRHSKNLPKTDVNNSASLYSNGYSL